MSGTPAQSAPPGTTPQEAAIDPRVQGLLDLAGPLGGICYSGFRRGQGPHLGVHPTRAQTEEDLRLLAPRWKLLRLYDCDAYAESILALIRELGLGLRVLLGAWIDAEVSNPRCPWGGMHDARTLAANRARNEARIEQLIALANRYPDVVAAVSAGNEATAEWTDHLVPPARVLQFVERLKAAVPQPVTFCENHVPWMGPLDALAAAVDFVSLHTYPLWEHRPVGEALAHTQADLARVAARHPGKPVVITEAGWATRADGRGFPAAHAGEAAQAEHFAALTTWARQAGVLVFWFEAFDEPWKGSESPDEPEKHWGLFTVDREPKQALAALGPAAA